MLRNSHGQNKVALRINSTKDPIIIADETNLVLSVLSNLKRSVIAIAGGEAASN